jgi:hypothetical protein
VLDWVKKKVLNMDIIVCFVYIKHEMKLGYCEQKMVLLGEDMTNLFSNFQLDVQNHRLHFQDTAKKYIATIKDFKMFEVSADGNSMTQKNGWFAFVDEHNHSKVFGPLGSQSTSQAYQQSGTSVNASHDASTNFVTPETSIRWAHTPQNTAIPPSQHVPSYALPTTTTEKHDPSRYMYGANAGQPPSNSSLAYPQQAAATPYQSQPSSDQSYYVQPASSYAAQDQPSAVAHPSYLTHSISQQRTQSDTKEATHEMKSFLEAITQMHVDHSKGTKREIADRDQKMLQQLAEISDREISILADHNTKHLNQLDIKIKAAIEEKQKEIGGAVDRLSNLTYEIHQEKLKERHVKQRHRNERHAETHKHLTTMHVQHAQTHQRLKLIHDQHGETHQNIEDMHKKLDDLMEKHHTRTGADEDGKVALQYFKAAHKIPDGLFIKVLSKLGSDSASLSKLAKILASNEREATRNKAKMERLSALLKKLKESKEKHHGSEYNKHYNEHHFEQIKRFIPDYKGHIEGDD